ncbi:MAG: hypothetical protein WAN50_01505 [Minisyncoccia bacterium]
MKGAEGEFLKKHTSEFGPLLDPKVTAALDENRDLTPEQVAESIERVETKVFKWERGGADTDGKRILLEAAEPAAFRTVQTLVEFLEKDERCGAITLVTDNIAGKNFVAGEESLGLKQVRNPGQPVLADIEGPFDSVLVLAEPKNSPDKPFLFGGKSVYGGEKTKIIYLIDGVLSSSVREWFADSASEHMDCIDTVCVANEFSKELLAAAVPQLKDRITAVGSILLQGFKNDLIKNKLFEAANAAESRRSIRNSLHVPLDSVMVLYSGFPSADYESMGGKAGTDLAQGEKTLNQDTFERTFRAVLKAARENPDKQFALAVRTHPRAAGIDNDLQVPSELPENLHVAWANGPVYNYDEVAGAADIVACQSTSTEVLYAPYRGVVAAVSGYPGHGMQQEINEKIFGDGLSAFRSADGLLYVESESALADYLKNFQTPPARRPVPDDPIPSIADLLLAAK